MKRGLIFCLTLMLVLALAAPAFAETTVVRLTCTGDVMLGCNDRVRDQDYSIRHYIDQYGFAYPFEKLQVLIGQDDITLSNMECVFNSTEPDSTSRLRFRAPETYVQALVEGSIEVVNLANNHFSDFGKAAHDTTVRTLDAAGVKYCGCTEYGSYACYVDVKGVRIGFVGVIPLWHKDHARDTERCFQQLKDAGCQVIVASLHCGTEYNETHGNIHDSYGSMLRANGANIIIGNHPHVPQGVSVKDGVTQIYSLGNNVFGGNTGVDEEIHYLGSTVAAFDLYFEDGVYIGHQMTLWPIHISGAAPENNYQPVLVEGEDAQRIMRRIQKDTEFTLNPYVDGQGAVQDFVPWNK